MPVNSGMLKQGIENSRGLTKTAPLVATITIEVSKITLSSGSSALKDMLSRRFGNSQVT